LKTSNVSPVGAYDAESDSFLVLDVNPANADWVWMPTKTLVNGKRTFDKIENRGYILVQPTKFALMHVRFTPESGHVRRN
jgi:hypothetical protein